MAKLAPGDDPAFAAKRAVIFSPRSCALAVADNVYHFIDRWRVEGDVKEVADILEDALNLPRWWGSTYFGVKEVEPGIEHGIGKLISLHAGGWLPYTLRINFRTVESRYPNGFTMDASGDLEGKGIWTFEQDGPFVNITYDWTIQANKPIIEKLSFLLKPVFRSNHNWTMKRGEESLKLELFRRRAKSSGKGSSIPAPPPPSFVIRLLKLNRP
jgi:hypothetical protein